VEAEETAMSYVVSRHTLPHLARPNLFGGD
jgi:hypothetical protein